MSASNASDLAVVGRKIVDTRSSTPAERSVLAAVTGIDDCGKGYVTARIVDLLRGRGIRAAAVNVDGWLNPPLP